MAFGPTENLQINYGEFDIDLFSGSLLADMKNIWPPKNKRTGSRYFLWEHEFKAHGFDFSDIYRKQHIKEF